MSKPKNNPFFQFKDDQDINSESDTESNAIPPPPPPGKQDEEEQKNQQGELNHNQINVKGGIPEHEEVIDEAEIKQPPKKKKSFTQKAALGFITIILQLFFNITVLYPLMLLFQIYDFFRYLITICCSKDTTFQRLIESFFQITFSSSILLVCFYTFYGILKQKDDIYSIWYFDSFILFFSHIMIFSMIQFTKQNSVEIKLENVCSILVPNNYSALICDFNTITDNCEVMIDIPRNAIEWEQEYKRILGNNFEVELDSQRFNTFTNKLNHPDILQYIGYQLIKGFEEPLRSNQVQFFTLQCIMLLKIVCSVLYLKYHSIFNWDDILNVLIITVFSFNEVYCLNFILSNYDLRRKTLMCQNINSAIVISGKIVDYEKIIDITNSESIETWDNSRRCVYEFFSDMQKSLERNYVCLFLYYLIVTNIILAAYGEIYLIISKESFFLNPLIVISSTFTFIFLNTLIFFRLYYGSKFNETFEECEDTVDNLIGIYQDLIQMYDYNFNQRGLTKQDYLNVANEQYEEEEQQQEQENDVKEEIGSEIKKQNDSRQLDEEQCASQLKQDVNYYTCYHIMISKFMYLSEYYIEKGIEFQGKVYNKAEEKILQQKMMQNCLKSFRRIKQQIIVDAKLQCYQAFNIVKLDFKDTLFTICLGLLTLLPSIITKFIEQFKIIEEATKPS